MTKRISTLFILVNIVVVSTAIIWRANGGSDPIIEALVDLVAGAMIFYLAIRYTRGNQ